MSPMLEKERQQGTTTTYFMAVVFLRLIHVPTPLSVIMERSVRARLEVLRPDMEKLAERMDEMYEGGLW